MGRVMRLVFLNLILILVLTATAALAAGQIHVIPVEGTIEPGLASFIARVMVEAEEEQAQAVLLEVNTFGGRVDAAIEIRDRIRRSKVPVYAFVADRAWSAGALITLACPEIAMAPGSSIGAAEPRPNDEKTISALRAEFETTAASTGRDQRVAAAMVDQDIEIEGVTAKGELLTLAAEKAFSLGIADMMAASREDALEKWNLTGEVVLFQPTVAESVVRFLTEPTVSSLLLTLGFLGLLFEFFTAGWGVGGTIGLISLGLFFGARIIAGLAGWEVVVLFLVGLLLLILEVLVLPGFGVAGLGGIVAILASIVMSFHSMRVAAYSITGAVVMTVILAAFLSRYFKRSRAWDKLVLRTAQKRDQGYVATKNLEKFVGQEGTALTTLRPSGTIVVNEERLDAVTEGGFIAANARVRVVRVEGSRIIVRAAE